MRLILASNSKARKAIFDSVGWKYEILTSKVEEKSSATNPEEYVIELSKCKAISVANQISDNAIIVAADSIIYMNNKKFEKPKTKEECFQNFKEMSGNLTYAITGVTIKDLYHNKEVSFSDITEVYFKELSDDDIFWYIKNEPYIFDTAGYAVEGKASIFVNKVIGDYNNILGLPVGKVYDVLKDFGYSINDFEMIN